MCLIAAWGQCLAAGAILLVDCGLFVLKEAGNVRWSGYKEHDRTDICALESVNKMRYAVLHNQFYCPIFITTSTFPLFLSLTPFIYSIYLLPHLKEMPGVLKWKQGCITCTVLLVLSDLTDLTLRTVSVSFALTLASVSRLVTPKDTL